VDTSTVGECQKNPCFVWKFLPSETHLPEDIPSSF
jgi:hypothetical protein